MSAILSEETYGTGKKKLSIYILGVVLCIFLTLVSFITVIYSTIATTTMLLIILISALMQFVVQVVCFLRLNVKNEQSRINLISFIFTIAIFSILIGGSLWIMWNLHYRMIH